MNINNRRHIEVGGESITQNETLLRAYNHFQAVGNAFRMGQCSRDIWNAARREWNELQDAERDRERKAMEEQRQKFNDPATNYGEW